MSPAIWFTAAMFIAFICIQFFTVNWLSVSVTFGNTIKLQRYKTIPEVETRQQCGRIPVQWPIYVINSVIKIKIKNVI